MSPYLRTLATLIAAVAAAPAENTVVDGLLERIVRQEQEFTSRLRSRSALLETYTLCLMLNRIRFSNAVKTISCSG